MALEYTFNVLVEPLQMVVKLAFKLSITGLALTVTLIDAMAEQPSQEQLARSRYLVCISTWSQIGFKVDTEAVLLHSGLYLSI